MQSFLYKLYAAIFLSAYFGLLRISEIAKGLHTLLARNVHVGVNKNKILFVLQSSKTHTKGDKPRLIKIQATPLQTYKKQGSNKPKKLQLNCPFKTLKDYIAVRLLLVSCDEPFFVYSDRTPVAEQNVRKTLRDIIGLMGLDSSYYSFHCFRVGRSCDLLNMGISVETIKKIGCWKSNAVFTYLRN